MKVKHILASKGMNVITIRPDQQVRDAIAMLTQHGIGALVVVDDSNKPVGIISERDIVRHAAVDEEVFSQIVSSIMTRNLITGIPQDDIASIAHTMTENRFRHLPIVEGDDLIGIISIGDVLKAERDEYRGEIDTLETQLLAGEV